MINLGSFRKLLLGISPEETRFSRRGFGETKLDVKERLEHIGEVFVQGYHAALEQDNLILLERRLASTELEFRGFAFEGAAMGLFMLDRLLPFHRNRWHTFANGPGAPHLYMAYVGVGWALARLPWLCRQITRPLSPLHPVFGWLAIDGYGFHHGYFHGLTYIERRVVPRQVLGYARQVFDQGLGRSLWFVNGADIARITKTITSFPATRQGDLWSGIGLASAYAGGVDRTSIKVLCDAAGRHRADLAQGAAFAAKARQRAGNPVAHTDMACQVLCRLSADDAARITDEALRDLPGDGEEPAYEIWRRRIREQLMREG
jgi:hypothetical protein